MALALFLFVPCTALAMEYGKTGPYNVVRESVKNPKSGDDVTVFLPDKAQMPVPVMFFSHGLGGNYYQAYKSMLMHVASQGVAVVFSPYPTGLSWAEQYDLLWSGFEEAASDYQYEFDLDRVGFLGHSWGGGASPNMALRAVAKGWGRQGMLMFIMAPAPAYGVTDQDLRSLTDATLIMQVYENDTNAPHRIAEDIYATVGIPNKDKAYYFVLGAKHSEPSERSVDDYDRLAIWTPLDALMDYTFNMDHPYDGKAFALDGEGDHYKTDILADPTEASGGSGGSGKLGKPGWPGWSGSGGWFDRIRNR